jgi:hypothetical protein
MSPYIFNQCTINGYSNVFLDECDKNLLVEGAVSLINNLRKSKKIFATTGAPLTKEQLKFL